MTPKPDFLSIIKLVIYYDVMYPNPKKKTFQSQELKQTLNSIEFYTFELWPKCEENFSIE